MMFFGCHNNAQFIALLTDYTTVSQQAMRAYKGRRSKLNTSLRWRCKIKLTGQLHALVPPAADLSYSLMHPHHNIINIYATINNVNVSCSFLNVTPIYIFLSVCITAIYSKFGLLKEDCRRVEANRNFIVDFDRKTWRGATCVKT